MEILKDKSIIITGATSGMGKAIAERFSKEGAYLTLSGRNQQRGTELINKLPADRCQFIAGDVGLIETNEMLATRAIEKFGKIDCVVTNAGELGLGSVTDVSYETWNSTLNSNLNAVFYLLKFVLPKMLENGGGNVIANGSIAAFKVFPNHPAYCASKAGLVSLIKQVALDYSPSVRANVICPGPVDTPLIWNSAQAFDQPEQAVEGAKNATLLKRLGKPEDIANLALFLASEESAWITGSSITIDGGIMTK
ncbi:SDR family oxidoreductase [Fulvivirgaceae bacterium BMA10]|uniref:SDR family oxidoreductase n=1 Tax=Splendidivirga corallicola TaxID=3051826 RepID=A0ABT8KTA4_9BACT|nr:SDR family oxidoreductase [Fulvivirgaceae bacterium BMA10]